MHKVKAMTMIPAKCLYCGRGNTEDDDEDGREWWYLDMERDVNWGDSVYLCCKCVDKIAVIGGFIADDQMTELQDLIDQKNVEIHELKAENDSLRRRLRTIAAGVKTVRRVKRKEKATS